jgi:hypothetical protein
MFAFAGVLIVTGIVYIVILVWLTGLPAEPIVLGIFPQWMFWSVMLWFVYLGIFLYWSWKMSRFFTQTDGEGPTWAPDSPSNGDDETPQH